MNEPERVPETEDVDEPEPTATTEAPAADGPGPGLPPPTGVESLVGALLEAGPEVAEHVVRAAQELLLAVQVIVDAADRAVQEQQRIQTETAAAADPGVGSDAGATADADVAHADVAHADVAHADVAHTDVDGASAVVRHLDIAE